MITYGPCTFVYITYSAGTDHTATLSIVNNIISIYSTLVPNTTFSIDSVNMKGWLYPICFQYLSNN